MGYPDRRGYFIDILTAVTTGPECVYLQVVLIYLKLRFFDFRQDGNGNGRGVNPAAGFGDGYALDPVDTFLEVKVAVCILAFDEEYHFLIPADITRMR
jgi:hypothetical protein